MPVLIGKEINRITLNWNLFTVLNFTLALIELCIGLYHLFLGAKRYYSYINISFAATSLLMGSYSLLNAFIYANPGVAESVHLFSLQMFFVNLLVIAFCWFMYHYTDYPSAVPFWIITGIFILFALLEIVFWNTPLTSAADHPLRIEFVFRNRVIIRVFQGDPGPLMSAKFLCAFFSMVFGFTVALRRVSVITGRKDWIIVPAVLFFFSAGLNDIAVASGLYSFMFVLEYAHFFLILSLNLIIINHFLNVFRAHENLNRTLEQRVLERTEDLRRARDQILQEMNLAKKVEFSLLPSGIPELSSLSIAYKYLPASAVGGDFIDIQYREGSGRIGFFICDVSGHGVSAALIASMVKMSLAGWEEYFDSPSEHLHGVRRALMGKMSGHFISACSAVYDLDSGRLKMASAGHPPLMVLRSQGGVEDHKPPGRVLCDRFEARCEDREILLEKGDAAVLYTDGITEARHEGLIFGEERFRELLKEKREGVPEDICGTLVSAVRAYRGKSPQEDDYSLLVVKRR